MDKKLTVLVTDTSVEYGQVCATLRSHGMTVIEVPSDGQDILDSLHSVVPEVVLMNAHMARINALGVMKAIDAMNLPKKPVIMVMSPDSNGVSSSEMMKAGASYFFTTPYDHALLAKRISQLVGLEDNKKRILDSAKIPYSPAKGVETLVSATFHQIGIPAHLKGYYFLREAILITINDPHAVNMITKQIYPPLAKKHSTTISSVERSIRHAIEVAWGRGDAYTLAYYFGSTMDSRRGKPTNSKFIATISGKLRLQLAR